MYINNEVPMKKIAVLIPCYNEELTVKKVVSDFRNELPEASIYVYDNNSTDKTAEYALEAGAIVCSEHKQGKGNVVKSMFRDIEADCYIMVDGDDTYPADEIHRLIKPVLDGDADMVIGDRLSNGTYFEENKRGFHNLGNRLVQGLINSLFNSHINDIMTGYRVFSKKFVKCMPVMSDGFQIETEMSIFSLVNGMNIVEIPITYRDRPEGSESKLSTFKDGYKVLMTLFDLFKNNRPLLFFGSVSLFFIIIGLMVGIPVLVEFSASHYITKVPSAILAASLMILSIISFAIGIIVDAIKNQTKTITELYINHYILKQNEKKN